MSKLHKELSELLKAHDVSSEITAKIITLVQAEETHDQPTLHEPMKTLTLPFSQRSPGNISNFWKPNTPTKSDDVETLTTHYNQAKYHVLGILGIGGMGRVLKIYDPQLKRNLAMKILHPAMMESQQLVARFYEEAQLIAQMQHPNIVPIHEVGVLDDGRLFFTMKEIQGSPLHVHIKAVHDAIQDNQWQMTESGWSLRRLVEVFRQCCETVAYSHSLGVIHRDLKPDNILLGEFGEVLVSDWGIAKVLSDIRSEEALSQGKEIETDRSPTAHHATQFGQVTGTPAYMPPEQAKGEITELDHRCDIYALGAVLYEILLGRRPYSENKSEDTLHQVIAGPPRSLRAISIRREKGLNSNELSPRPKLPPILVDVCEKAMARDKTKRYNSAAQLGKVIGDWLDGVQKREQSLEFVQKAAQTRIEKRKREERAREMHLAAQQGLQQIPSWEGENVKGEWWKHEEDADDCALEAKRLDILRVQQLYAALAIKGDLPEAHQALAQLYREKHAAAEQSLDADAAMNNELRLREHLSQLPANDPKKADHFYYLKGSGALSVVIEDDVDVQLEKFIPHHRRLIAKTIAKLGNSPIVSRPMEMGSYRLRIKRHDHPDVLYPVFIGRGEHWDCRDARGIVRALQLPSKKELGENERLVAEGWFKAGGDPVAPGALDAKKIWLPSFSIRRHQITNAEYLLFLNDLVQAGKSEEALRYAPRERVGESDQLGAVVYHQNEAGHFQMAKNKGQDTWQLDWPVMMVDWFSCRAYAKWLSEKSGQNWRLPTELEWEKAGRGVDGRIHAWGNGFDPSYCCLGPSHKEKRTPVSVHAYPIDESVYGVRGMSGNVVDWTDSKWAAKWEDISDEEPDSNDSLRVYKGGGWYGVPWFARLAYRYWYDPAKRLDVLGFRLCRSIKTQESP